MIYRFAVDPGIFDSYDRFMRVFEPCSICNCRMIVDYPQKWDSAVVDAIKRIKKPVERKKIKLKLLRGRDRILHIPPDIPYRADKRWLENAEIISKTVNLRGIVAKSNPRNMSNVVQIDDLDDGNRTWNTPREYSVPRTPNDMASCVAELLGLSTHIFFIDPHFNPSDHRWTDPIREFLHKANIPPIVSVLEYHTSNKDGKSTDLFRRECEQFLPRVIPKGMRIAVRRWSDEGDGEKFHDRFIVTDRGGYQFGHGLTAAGSRSRVNVTMLGRDRLIQLRRDFALRSTDLSKCAFSPVHEPPPTIKGIAR